MRRRGGPLTLVVGVESGEIAEFRSDPLGELLDRATNAVGFQVTERVKAAVDLKLANRLLNARGAPIVATRQAALSLVEGLLGELPSVHHRWYWFANPGFELPADSVEERVEFVDSCVAEAGFNLCLMPGPDGEEIDLRDRTSFNSPAGTIDIRSESAEQRYRPELERLRTYLLGQAPLCTLQVSLIPRRRPGKRVKTMDPKRLPGRPRPIRLAMERVLGERLRAAGFHRLKVDPRTWVRATDASTDYVVAERERFDSAVRVCLGRDRHPDDPAGDGTRAEVFPADRSASSFSFDNDASLLLVLDAIWLRLDGAGLLWLASPSSKSRQAWLELGVFVQ